MKKRIGTAALILVLVLMTFAACSQEEGTNPENPYASSDIDAMPFAEYLAENISFVDEMTVVDNDIALDFYGIDAAEIYDAAIYMSTGATAEEIAVITVGDDETAKAVADIYEARIANQTAVFEDYVPAELAKLETALIIQVDNAMVYVACDDPSEAEEAIIAYAKEYLAEK